jgi:hypothetical protein
MFTTEMCLPSHTPAKSDAEPQEVAASAGVRYVARQKGKKGKQNVFDERESNSEQCRHCPSFDHATKLTV